MPPPAPVTSTTLSFSMRTVASSRQGQAETGEIGRGGEI
jgi:hypothetical protein